MRRIQPTARIVYSDIDIPQGSYWRQMAALGHAALGDGKERRILMIGSCGWSVAAAWPEPSDRWWGIEPDAPIRALGMRHAANARINTAIAFATPEELAAAQPMPFDCVIVDAYVMDEPVQRWQSVAEVLRAFRVRALAPVVIHGEVGVGTDRYRVVRA